MTTELMADWKSLPNKDRYSNPDLIWEALEAEVVVLIRGKWMSGWAERKSRSEGFPITGYFTKQRLRLRDSSFDCGADSRF